MDRILLTDGQQRKTLAAVRSLGGQGDQVFVADETRFSTSRFSRYCHRGLLSPPPDQTDQYWTWLLDVQRRHDLEVLLPMDDLTTALAVERQHQLPYLTLLPTAEQFAVGRDKAKTAALAARAGVRSPRTTEARSLAEAETALERLGTSAVLKARVSAGGRGIFFVADAAGVRSAWAKAHAEWGGFLVQERIPLGRKFDVCLLFGASGDLRASFVQEELRWFPLEHGASTLQESVSRPDLVALALQLLSPIGWRGPVEVEFMLDAAGEPVLMEINPRFWASLALAIRCGVDFPRLTAALAAGRSVSGPDSYPLGVRCRWLLPGDLLHASASRFQMDPGFFATYDRRTFDDILSSDDPGPALGVVLAMIRYSCDLKMWRLLMRW
jgi:predicted ATP-grasp superfamily ATP-dependent carboligase